MVHSYHIVLFYCSAAVLTGDLLISVGGYWGSGTSDFGNVAVNMRHFAFWSGNSTDFAPMTYFRTLITRLPTVVIASTEGTRFL